MEINNQLIQTELFPVSDKANELCKRLMREEGYLRDSLEKVQHHFGDQAAGRTLVSELTQAMREVRCAYCELEQLKGEVIEFTRVLTN